MPDGGDRHGFRPLINAVHDQIGEAWHGQTAHTLADMPPGLRMIEENAQGGGELVLHMLRSLRIARADVGSYGVKVGFGARG